MEVVLTGAEGALGHRTREGVTAIGHHVVTMADGSVDTADDRLRRLCVDLEGSAGDSYSRIREDAPMRVVVDLGSSDHDRRAARRQSATETTASTLAIADRVGAEHVVFVSSAMVYGAAANNPVPLTEEATLRPEVDFVFARQLASSEELVEQWRLAAPCRTTTVLRPAVALAADGSSRLATALVHGLGRRLAQADPPSQFLHLDDLATAVTLAVEQRLDGVYNVAPDGWIAGERVRALSGERPRLPLPERVGDLVTGLRWRFQRGPIPPGLLAYTREPWVVSNDRLRGAGWEPTVTNEQTYVEGTDAPWWTVVSPKRRQELALGAAVVGVILAAAVGIVAGRRRLATRRASALRRR